MKVLISAYACEPDKGSEPGVGWAWAREMSRKCDLWILTRANNRRAIESSVETWASNVHWLYYDLPYWAAFWKKGPRGANLYYWVWQLFSWIRFRQFVRNEKFDVIHHATFGRYWVPSWLGLLDSGFVFGPVGGAEDTPPGLTGNSSLPARMTDMLRTYLRFLAKFDPILRRTLQKDRSIVIAATEETRARLKEDIHPKRLDLLPQCALDDAQIERLSSLPPPLPERCRVISIGRLVHWKGYHIGLQAFAVLAQRIPQATYWIVNDGPELDRLRQLASSLGISERVIFWGKLQTLDEVYSKLAQADILLHPAFHEAFGNVCLEAMAAGRPVVCLAGGGPGMQITDDVGVAVEPGNEKETVNAIAEALIRVGTNNDLLVGMSERAKLRASKFFSWRTNAAKMYEFYSSLE